MEDKFIRMVQIENNTNCNYSCWFCQNRYYRRPPAKAMDMELFEHILKEVRKTYTKEEMNITSFSVYNEPTLDPLFIDRLRMMTDMGFDHLCAVNGSNMAKEMVDTIVKERFSISELRINLPTVDSAESQKIMGIPSSYHKKILSRLDYVFEKMNEIGVPVKLMVNGNGTEDHKREAYAAYDRFKHHQLEVGMSAIMNRAGMLDHVIQGKIYHGPHDEFICGMRYFEHVYFGIKGNIFYYDYFAFTIGM